MSYCNPHTQSHLIEWFKINKMQANPDKFQVLAVGKKTYEKRPTINIQNFELTCEDSIKLLGIEIDYQLNFDTHISTICRKASQQLNIIKRLGSYYIYSWTFFIGFLPNRQNLKFIRISLHFVNFEPFNEMI
jgi:hypothetical protein